MVFGPDLITRPLRCWWPVFNAMLVLYVISQRVANDEDPDDSLLFLHRSRLCATTETKTCMNRCTSRGFCVNGKCICRPGWAGVYCSIPHCQSNCSSTGLCLKTGKCLCQHGWVGSDCSIERFEIALPSLLARVGSPYTSNTNFAENLDLVMSYKSVHKYGFLMCKTPMCKANWDFALTAIFPSLARDDMHPSLQDCAVVSSSKELLRVRSKGWAEEIDKHQVVMRLDNAPTRGYEQSVGRRTTHRLVSAEYARFVHGLLGSVVQTSNNNTRMLVNANSWWDSGVTPSDRLTYIMSVKMTPLGKGEWRALEKSSLGPFRDVFPGPRKYVLSPVFMSRVHLAWERLKTAVRELDLGCYKKRHTHVPGIFIAALYSLQVCRKVDIFGMKLEKGEQGSLAPHDYQSRARLDHEHDTDCCYYQQVTTCNPFCCCL